MLKSSPCNHFTLLTSYIVLALIYCYTGGSESPYKIIFLPAIILYAVRFGLKWGLAASGMTAFTLIAADMIALARFRPLNLKLDLLYIGTFFLASWLVGSLIDLERAINNRLLLQVNRDDLTGLYNCRFLRNELKRKIEQGKENGSFVLAVISLDFFTSYREIHGYQAGDQLLSEIAGKVAEFVGDSGRVFRCGDEEFAVIMEPDEREKVFSRAETIRRFTRDIAASFMDDNYRCEATVSLGLSFYPADAATGEELLSRAGRALYKAREIGGNRVETYYSVLEPIRPKVKAGEIDFFDKLDNILPIINARDRYTYGHSERVLFYVSIVASLIGMPRQARRHLLYGAYLHDIGKYEIDREILNKPGKLNAEEWAIIKKHPLKGADIARQVRVLNPSIPAILFHHERYDGGGYPFNLKGKEIPLEGRIMALADSFDAMTRERPYKKGISYSEAIKEIKSKRESQFDPNLVDFFINFLKQYQNIDELLDTEIRFKYMF